MKALDFTVSFCEALQKIVSHPMHVWKGKWCQKPKKISGDLFPWFVCQLSTLGVEKKPIFLQPSWLLIVYNKTRMYVITMYDIIMFCIYRDWSLFFF